MGTYTATATVDLDAIQGNLERITELARGAEVMAAVKADAYGHGLIPVARAALAGGATWLGTAQLVEALALRAAGIDAPILAWLFTPGESLIADCVSNRIDLSASDTWALDEIAAAGGALGIRPRVHLEVDTGMSRGGVQLPEFAAVARAAAKAHADGSLDVVGIWTHLACADTPGHPSIAAQYTDFDRAIVMLTDAGLTPRVRHIANSAATVTGLPTYDLVRAGLICYGLSPVEATPAELGLRPALRLTAALANVKSVAAGSGVSYGHTHIADSPTRIGVVPLGYGDGIPRQASNVAEVTIGGQRLRIAGRVCMDQFMIDLGGLDAAPGTEVVLIGDAARGEVTATDWAQASGTINYEIVTRLGTRIPRRYVGGPR